MASEAPSIRHTARACAQVNAGGVAPRTRGPRGVYRRPMDLATLVADFAIGMQLADAQYPVAVNQRPKSRISPVSVPTPRPTPSLW